MIEEHLGRSRGCFIAGVDEVGRGAFAGNLVVAAASFHHRAQLPRQIYDSKHYQHAERVELVQWFQQAYIQTGLLHVAYAETTPDVIDANNLDQLTRQLFVQALQQLPQVDAVIVDGRHPLKQYTGVALPKADTLSITVAVASIFAKVHRDTCMIELAKQYPKYHFDVNMGYGTPDHIQAIKYYGLLEGIHRRSFIKSYK